MTSEINSVERGWPLIEQGEDGLHLRDSILWLDSRDREVLSFLSHVPRSQKTKAQIIATEETVKVLQTFGTRPRALVCQYNRPFSLGRLKLELLPSGFALGGASLWIEFNKTTLLYASKIQTQSTEITRKAQPKKANILVLGAHEPMDEEISRKKEKAKILSHVAKAVENHNWLNIFCDVRNTAPELTKALAAQGIPLLVHPKIYHVNKLYEHFGCDLGRYQQWSPRSPKERVTLLPLYQTGKMAQPSRRLTVVNCTAELHDFHSFREQHSPFLLPASAGWSDMRTFIKSVQPDRLIFFGPYAKRYQQEFSEAAPTVEITCKDSQPPLF